MVHWLGRYSSQDARRAFQRWADVIWLRTETRKVFDVLFQVALSSLAFSRASEHLSPWISGGRLKARVLLRDHSTALSQLGGLGDREWSFGQSTRARGSARSQPNRQSSLHFTSDFTLLSNFTPSLSPPLVSFSLPYSLLCTTFGINMSWQGCARLSSSLDPTLISILDLKSQ